MDIKDLQLQLQDQPKPKQFKYNIDTTDDDHIIKLKENKLLSLAISQLPSNYNFEIYKTISKINSLRNELISTKKISQVDPILIAIQLPDGFAYLSVILSDIIQTFSDLCETVILGDITYGACCIDDIGCHLLGVDLLLHYGHSCLVPVTSSLVKIMYIFVDIMVDIDNCVEIINENFDKKEKLTIMGSIQYNNSVFLVKKLLLSKGFQSIDIPQAKPRSSGEVLGCTSPFLDHDHGKNVIFICDGRFHMESLMISNPHMCFYQYDPFLKRLSYEEYDYIGMLSTRKSMINKCFNSKKVGIIFGTLGRQGNEGILTRMIEVLIKRNIEYEVILLSEVTEEKLKNFSDCDFFVQIACPRLSIDWGIYFSKPVLPPFEFYVVFQEVELKDKYPMDYYSYEGGKWSNYYGVVSKKIKK